MTETQKSKELANINDCALSGEIGMAMYKPAGQISQIQNGNPTFTNDRDLKIAADGAQPRYGHAEANNRAVAAPHNGNVGGQDDTNASNSRETQTTTSMTGTSIQPAHSYNGIATLCRRVLNACQMGSLSCPSDQNLGALRDKGLAILLKKISAIFKDHKLDGSSYLDTELDAKSDTEDFIGEEAAVGVKVTGSYGSETADQISATTMRRKPDLPKWRKKLLLDLPYDVRRDIYSFYYPVNRNVQLTDGPPEWNALRPKRDTYRMTSDGLNLLRTCRQLNDEIVQLVYGKNTFLLAPGERDYPWPKVPNQPRANTELFLSNLRVSTKQTVKTLQLCLGPCMRHRLINKLCANLRQIPRIVVTVDPLNQASLIPVLKTKQRKCLRDSCRKVALARGNMPPEATLWDDCGDAAIARMLDSAMPNGYRSVFWAIGR